MNPSEILKDMETVWGEDYPDSETPRLITETFADAHNIRRVLARLCSMPPGIPEFQNAGDFPHDNWPEVLFKLDDNPIDSDQKLIEQVNKGLKSEKLPRSDWGVVKLLMIWLWA